MQKQDREILKIFQTEDNRKIEEDFASMLSENLSLRLFFINENQAYTDGKNIVVDPANDELFCDYIALKNTEEFLGLPQSFSNDRFIALKIITRAQNIHEALHIIYTNFPPDLLKDPRGKNNKFNQMILSSISNIIEDKTSCFFSSSASISFIALFSSAITLDTASIILSLAFSIILGLKSLAILYIFLLAKIFDKSA